jgi:hypothetical protein
LFGALFLVVGAPGRAWGLPVLVRGSDARVLCFLFASHRGRFEDSRALWPCGSECGARLAHMRWKRIAKQRGEGRIQTPFSKVGCTQFSFFFSFL